MCCFSSLWFLSISSHTKQTKDPSSCNYLLCHFFSSLIWNLLTAFGALELIMLVIFQKKCQYIHIRCCEVATPSNMISYGVGLLTSGWSAFNSANYFLVCIETFNLATSLSLIDNAIITLYVSETFFCMFLYYFLRVFLHPCFLFSSVSNFPCTHSHDKLYLVVIQMDVFPWKPFWETFQLSFKLLLFYTAWAIPTSWQFSITSTNPSFSSISPIPVSSSFSQC